MPRTARSMVGGYAYHVLNRANGRLRLFKKQADFLAFEQLLAEIHERVPLRILGYSLMANHWHFVVWPRHRQDEQVSDFFRRLTRRLHGTAEQRSLLADSAPFSNDSLTPRVYVRNMKVRELQGKEVGK